MLTSAQNRWRNVGSPSSDLSNAFAILLLLFKFLSYQRVSRKKYVILGNLTSLWPLVPIENIFFKDNFVRYCLFTHQCQVISWAPLDSRLTLHPNVECVLHAWSGKRDDLEQGPRCHLKGSPFLWFIYATDNNVLQITMIEDVKRRKVPAGPHPGHCIVQQTLTEFHFSDEEEVAGLWTPFRTSTPYTWKACPFSNNVRTPDFVARVQKMVNQDPSKSIRSSRGPQSEARECIKVLDDKLKPWVHVVLFQQDSAPSHKDQVTQNWLTDNVPCQWSPESRPPSSPYLNPRPDTVFRHLRSDRGGGCDPPPWRFQTKRRRASRKRPADCSRRILAIGGFVFGPRSIFDPVMAGQRSNKGHTDDVIGQMYDVTDPRPDTHIWLEYLPRKHNRQKSPSNRIHHLKKRL